MQPQPAYAGVSGAPSVDAAPPRRGPRRRVLPGIMQGCEWERVPPNELSALARFAARARVLVAGGRWRTARGGGSG